VTKRPPTNIAASVRAKLLNIARASGEDFTYVLTRYALERLLARLARSPHRESFVLKGAMLFRVWSPQVHRPTKDLDLLGSGASDLDRLSRIFAEVCGIADEDDGVAFDPKGVRAERIKEDAEYEGVRVKVGANVGGARLELQIDIGFGDAVTPGVVEVEFPALLAADGLHVRAYPRETVVAEKVHAMVHLGIANSRMKDFFDLAFLAQSFSFEGAVLVAAMRATFERRGTPLPVERPLALTATFATDPSKMTQWKAFVTRGRLATAPATLANAVEIIEAFVWPPLGGSGAGAFFGARWQPGGPWAS
jgi:predicted nucleotidyltransferase component of viral defense system